MCSYNPMPNFYNISTQYNDSGFRPSPRTMTSRPTRTAPAPRTSPRASRPSSTRRGNRTAWRTSRDRPRCSTTGQTVSDWTSHEGTTSRAARGDSSDSSAVSVSMASVLLLGSVIARQRCPTQVPVDGRRRRNTQ
ncbi:hypothetical protein PHYSODRAFT_355173 [Phytophthora sojae]|uniref:Uncharacterized protein n=1 Tax=Phytophthora sojae (strain P6497) TaxID=1094619 RepID=G4ZYE4_PHYSP|nr:hypothetical protein PHYSODRAFT_355173 [Phytophthora sojae]EGZ11996.1 hypothetical protein PHYSODRAFT_355173 [Phytophthora sojae]|eukprot:XP_009532329.1 hypothetical protein PHYSODRAFT_355173 [Phytophthora sojae]